ncbi:MAG TPA: hypothetical protein VEP67_04930, partial [Thiobacillaceae bacterium]|nr:hypothetical protein [Thiobacillaceae bacterium]
VVYSYAASNVGPGVAYILHVGAGLWPAHCNPQTQGLTDGHNDLVQRALHRRLAPGIVIGVILPAIRMGRASQPA